MSTFLLQLSIGPVQGFIATARRTRDLWFGSWLLSEISKAAAKSIVDQPDCRLIFPNPAALDLLEAESEFLVANIILAELQCPAIADAKAVLESAKDAAQIGWNALCQETWDEIDKVACKTYRLGQVTQFLRHDVWEAQRADMLERFGGIVRVGDIEGGSRTPYEAANDQLRERLAQRKNTRNFAPYDDASALPKSSLDGMRSTVIQESTDPAQRAKHQRVRAALGIEPAEQLDLPGMVKRVLGRERAFVPVARIAADAWLGKAQQQAPAEFAKVRDAYAALMQFDLAAELKGKYRQYPWLQSFGYDAQLLYPARIEATRAKLPNLGLSPDDQEKADEALTALRNALRRLWKSYGEPGPYYALLLADGDQMGKLIDAATTHGPDAHRTVSRCLAEFAQAVPDEVIAHRGVCVYSGGDDVLAMVRLDKALECAEALVQTFSEHMNKAVASIAFAQGAKPAAPTLSVGIVIAHMLEPLGDIRQLAAQAERLAKKGSKGTPADRQRNALGLIIKPRSGSEYALRLRWDDQTGGLARLRDLIEAFGDETVPMGLPYELRDLLAREEALLGANIIAFWPGLCARVLDRKQYTGLTEIEEKRLKRRLFDALTKNLSSGENAMQRIEQLLCARWLSGRVGDESE